MRQLIRENGERAVFNKETKPKPLMTKSIMKSPSVTLLSSKESPLFELDTVQSDYKPKATLKTQDFLNKDEDNLEKAREIQSKNIKKFDCLDYAEELLLANGLDELKREELVKEYKNLYYQSRELKEILKEFNKNNKELQKDLVVKKEEIEKLKEIHENEIDGVGKKIREKENQVKEKENEIMELLEENREKSENIMDIQKQMQELLKDFHSLKNNFSGLQQENAFLIDKTQSHREDFSKREGKIRVVFLFIFFKLIFFCFCKGIMFGITRKRPRNFEIKRKFTRYGR